MMVLTAANIIGMIGFYVPIMFSANRAEKLGVSPTQAAFLLSIMGESYMRSFVAIYNSHKATHQPAERNCYVLEIIHIMSGLRSTFKVITQIMSKFILYGNYVFQGYVIRWGESCRDSYQWFLGSHHFSLTTSVSHCQGWPSCSLHSAPLMRRWQQL